MRYQDIRPNIKSGDLLAWTHKSWRTFSDFKIQLVRFFTQSEYSHVGIAYVVGGRVFVLEAVMEGVKITPLSSELPFFIIQTGMVWDDTVERVALAEIGESYSTWEAIKSFFVKIKVGDNHEWECAEYAMLILQAGGFPIDCKCTPSEVINWFQEHLDAPLKTITKE